MDELLAVKGKIAYILPRKVNADKLKQQKDFISLNAKLSILHATIAQVRRSVLSFRRTRSGRLAATSRIGQADCSSTPRRWMMSGCFGSAESFGGPTEERIIWRTRFQAQIFDLRGKAVLTRFDCCEFVKCTLLIDHGTEQLAFTECAFKDCNIDTSSRRTKSAGSTQEIMFFIVL